MSDEVLGDLRSAVHRKTYPRGAVLFNAGDEGEEVFLITRGLIKVSVVNDEGKELTLIINRPYDCLGEIALLDGSPRSAGATALEDLEVLSIHRRDFQRFLGEHPMLKDSIIRLLCWRLRHLTNEVVDFAYLNVYFRLSKKILDLAETFGVEEPEGIRIERKITQQELAQMVGTTREMVTRIVNEMKRNKLLLLRHGRFLVPHESRNRLRRASLL